MRLISEIVYDLKKCDYQPSCYFCRQLSEIDYELNTDFFALSKLEKIDFITSFFENQWWHWEGIFYEWNDILNDEYTSTPNDHRTCDENEEQVKEILETFQKECNTKIDEISDFDILGWNIFIAKWDESFYRIHQLFKHLIHTFMGRLDSE
jgi:hypothetical protein